MNQNVQTFKLGYKQSDVDKTPNRKKNLLSLTIENECKLNFTSLRTITVFMEKLVYPRCRKSVADGIRTVLVFKTGKRYNQHTFL